MQACMPAFEASLCIRAQHSPMSPSTGLHYHAPHTIEHPPCCPAACSYVNMEVNGVPVKAFIDSAAQITIMGKSFAERCGVLRLMDTRFQGVAVGVGSAKMLGEAGR